MMPSIHLDPGTLLTSETVISVMFALVLFIFGYRFRDVLGARRLGQAFLVSGIGTLLFLLSGLMPPTVNVLLANSALMLANLLFYDGVDELLRTKPKLLYPAAIALLSLFPLFWFTAIDNRLDLRIVLLSTTDCLMQVWLFIDLMRCSRKGLPVYLLSMSVLLSMVADLLRAAGTAAGGSAGSLLQHHSVQAGYMVTGVLAACGLGIFSLLLVTGTIVEGVENNARRDPLTGALNRRGIEELLKSEVDRAKRSDAPLVLALLDIDEFKVINDTGGHPLGDIILRDIASSISSSLRSYDACGRIGGDEFMVLLPGSHADGAAQICMRIMDHVATMPQHPQLKKAPTISLGFTELHDSDTVETLVARADKALYRAKGEGRNCACEEAHNVRGSRRSPSAKLPGLYRPLPGHVVEVGKRRDTRAGRLSV